MEHTVTALCDVPDRFPGVFSGGRGVNECRGSVLDGDCHPRPVSPHPTRATIPTPRPPASPVLAPSGAGAFLGAEHPRCASRTCADRRRCWRWLSQSLLWDDAGEWWPEGRERCHGWMEVPR